MYERMLDKSAQPDYAGLAAHCGVCSELFTALNDFLETEAGASREIRFPYGNSYGWCVTHRRKKKLICDVFAEKDAFCVMLRLTDAQFNSLYPSLLEYSRQLIDGRYPCGDGGWIHYRVTDAARLGDVERLLLLK